MRLTNQAERIKALRQVPVLSGLSRTNLGELARRAAEISVPSGAFLTRQGGSGNEVYIILDGAFEVRSNTRKIATRKRGDSFGEMSLIDGMPRSANVVAEKDSVVLVVHRQDFEQLLAIPRVARSVMRTLAGRLREADERILG